MLRKSGSAHTPVPLSRRCCMGMMPQAVLKPRARLIGHCLSAGVEGKGCV